MRDISLRRTLVETVGLQLIAGLAVGAFVAVPVLAIGGSRAGPPSVPAHATAQVGCLEVPVREVADSGISGHAQVCIVDEAVRPTMELENLRPGFAYTAWLTYFDRPETCRLTRCGIEDLVGDDPVGVLGRMDGIVANGTRKSHVWGDYRDLRLSPGSRVGLLLIRHASADEHDYRARARQLLTPQLPRLGVPAAGAPSDGQVGLTVAEATFDLPSEQPHAAMP